jgi:hypothetical protein
MRGDGCSWMLAGSRSIVRVVDDTHRGATRRAARRAGHDVRRLRRGVERCGRAATLRGELPAMKPTFELLGLCVVALCLSILAALAMATCYHRPLS